MPGIVWLVGAGPGDPGLITVRGMERLRAADVVVYDRLVHPDLLQSARPDAVMVYAGKEAGRHALQQDEINRVLVEHALQGRTVCRLKGGDPCVFGRGGEEAAVCAAAGIPFEIVSGVTSAIAAPACAGIPVTHRGVAASFAVVTGHRRPGDEGEQEWARIAGMADTLVFLMAVKALGEIVGGLIAHGRAPQTPVALIEQGTRSNQRTLVSTLAEVVDRARDAAIAPPALLVVGEVVRLREQLRWFDTRPLFGMRVLVTRAREQAGALSGLLRAHGAEPVEFPVIRFEPPDDIAALDAALAGLAGCRWVVFTSANGVRAVRDRLEAAGLDARAFGPCRIAAIGPATAAALGEMGLRADFVPAEYVAEAVVEQWPDRGMEGQRVLMPRAQEARDVLPVRLREMGATVDVIPAYRTVRDAVAAAAVVEQLEARRIDAVTFTSSSTVRHFVESIGADRASGLLSGVCVASIGPITSATAREYGIVPDVDAAIHTVPGLVEAMAASAAGWRVCDRDAGRA